MVSVKTVLRISLTLGCVANANLLRGEENREVRNTWVRCHNEDQLSDDLARGRIAWAKKCGYFEDDDVSYNTRKRLYPSFYHKNGAYNAPTSAQDSCEGWLLDAALICPWGCYTPEQRVLFSERYISIEDASKTETKITTLMEGSTFEKIEFQDLDIEAFILGKTKENVRTFTTETGKMLRVTDNHPLVVGNGLVKQASEIKISDSLIGVADELSMNLVKFEKITSIESEIYEGTVYNVQPSSTKQIENIIVAEGLLNGSNRFQNEWSKREFRIRARASRNIADL